MNATRFVKKGSTPALDVFGPTIEFLSLPTEGASFCVLRGVIPAGGFVPLHSHPDDESFLVLSGAVQVLAPRDDGLAWLDAAEGDFIEIPGGEKHAFRNRSDAPVVQLITTTPKLGRFFQEIGRPAAGAPPAPPTPEDVGRFVQVAARYGYWMASPEENAAAGIPLLA
jgi:quercetin dioxygenase-like cupin family protein